MICPSSTTVGGNHIIVHLYIHAVGAVIHKICSNIVLYHCRIGLQQRSQILLKPL